MWREVPGRPKYEYETYPASYGGSFVRTRRVGQPTLLASVHVLDEKKPEAIARGIEWCVRKLEAAK